MTEPGGTRWTMRPMRLSDLPRLLDVQQEGAVAGLAAVFPQDDYPFPRDVLSARWRDELADPAIAAYIALDTDGSVVGFAARREAELLHFGTALDTWGSGLAQWLHDALLATFPPGLDRVWLRVFVGNSRAQRFYEKLGWRSTGREWRTSFPPYPVLVEYELTRRGTEATR